MSVCTRCVDRCLSHATKVPPISTPTASVEACYFHLHRPLLASKAVLSSWSLAVVWVLIKRDKFQASLGLQACTRYKALRAVFLAFLLFIYLNFLLFLLFLRFRFGHRLFHPLFFLWVLCCLLGFGFCCDSFTIWYVSWYVRTPISPLYFLSDVYDLFQLLCVPSSVFICFPPEVIFRSRVIGVRPVTTDCIFYIHFLFILRRMGDKA